MAQPQVGEIIDGYRFNGGDPGSQESWSQGPSAGDVVDGYKFKGGDPSDEASWSVAKAESKGMLSSVAEAVGWKKGNDFKVPEGQVVTENTFTAGMPEEEAKPKRNIAMENSLMRGMDGTPATEQTEAVSDLPSVKKVSKPVSNFERQKESNRKWLDNSKALVVDQLISDNNLSPEDANFEFSRMRSYGVVPNATETGLRESTWGEAFDSGIAKVKPSFDKSMAGLASAKADATGDFDLANVADALRKTANAQLAEAEGILAGTSKDSWKKTISDAPASIAQNLPTIIAASAVASNPLLAGVIGNIGLAGMGMVSAGTAYSEGKDTGLNVSNNMQQSVLTGLAEVIPEKMSLNVLIGALGKNAAKQAMSDSIVQSAKTLGKYIGTEIGTEEITTIANFGIDKMYSKPDMPIKELVSQMIDTAKATLIQAPILGGAGIVTKAAVDGAGRVIDPVGYQLQGYYNAVERTNFAPMQSDGNTQAADAAKQSAMNAWSNGLAGAPKPTVKDITAAPDLDSAIRAAESVIADVAPVTIPDAPVQPPAPVAQIDPEIAALNQEATKIDQGKLLADIEAHINPTGTLTVTGKGAADAVRSLGEEIPFVQHKDGSVLVSARFAEPVSLAIQQAQQLTKPLGQTFTPMPIPATVASTLDANPIRPQTIAGQSAETYTDEQLAEITQSVTTNIDTRKGAAIELQARSVGQSTEPVVEQQPQPMQPTPVIESPVVSQPQRAKSKALKFTGNIINDLKVLGVNPRMLSRIVTDGTRATESIDDLSELAYRLRNELGYMFDDVNNDASQGLVEYLRRVSNNEVSPLNASRMEQDIADREEYLNKQSVIERAKELGLKGIGGKRTLAVVEADIARVEQERDDMEAREERAAIQAESAASEAFVADDAPMSEDDFRKYFAQSASVEYTQEDIDRAIEYQTNRENDRAEAATGYASEGETQGDSGQRNQDGETQEGTRGTAEEAIAYKEGKGLAKGKWFAVSNGEMSNAADTKEQAAESLKSILASKKANEDRRVAIDDLARSVSEKIKSGTQPTDKELYDLFGLEANHDYVYQEAVGAFLVKHLGVSRNRIKSSLGSAGGVRRSDFGAERNVAYPRKLHEVFGNGLTLTGETNAKESPPKYGIYQLADGSFAKFDRVWYRGEKTERAAMLSEMVIPGNASPKDRMGSQSWMFVKGFSRNEFDGSPLRLTKNGEDVTANVESPLELTGETNEEASANASRKIDPNALTKEEINAQSAGFGLQQQEGAPKPGPVQEGLRFSRVSDAPKGEELVAIHNLSAENVLHAASIGGIPVPSIGITKSASPFTGFGEITLIASNDMIDPDRSVPVFDRDAYTARFPTLNYKKVTAKKADDFYERMNVSRDLGDDGSSFMSQLWDAVKNDRVQSPDKLSRLFQTYTAPRMLYAKEVLGKEFKVPMRPIERRTFFGHEKSWRDFVKKNAELKRTDEDAYNKAAAKAIKVAADEFLEREGQSELRSIYMEEIDRYSGNGVNWNYLDRAIKDATDFGKKRVDAPKLVESVDKVVKQNDPAYLKWISEQVSGLFQEPTITLRGREVSASLDNIVEAMTIGATSGAEKTMTFGVGKTSALLGKRFKSIEEIKQSRDQVVSNNLKNQIKSENEKLLEDYRMKAVEFYTGKDWRGKIDTFAGFDDAMEALTKAGKMALTDGNIRLALQSKKFRGVSNEVIELARQSIDAIRSASTEYFEAKPQRAVKLREFKGAVVPKGTDPDVIAALENSGLTIVQYNSKSEGDRAAKVEKLAKSLNRVNKNVLFSNSSNATQSSAITEAEATTAITSNLGNAAKVLIDAGQIVLVRTEEGLRNLAGAKYMTAWHGSPHDHDKFDSSKIGTGEGAQAYGYGLYFAGARSVAEWYKNALAKPQIALDGEPLKFQSDDFANALRNILRQVKKGTSFYDAIDDEASILESSKMPSRMSDAQRLRGLKEGSVGEVNAGKLYKVELAPSEDQYLDWDKPLSEQSEFVREALKSVGLPKKYHSEDKTGRDIYHLLSGESASHITGRDDGQFGDKAASDYLHSIGIRGIRYLDGSSRGDGEGNSNYVIFSDDDVTITAKFAKEQGAIQGATLPDGRIVLVLENLNRDNIGGVLEHEGFHSSIRQLLGEKTYQQLMDRLGQLSKLNKSWAAQAEKSIPADTKPENWLEEIGAYAIEIYNRGEQLPGSIRKWVEDFLSAIRSAIISSKHMPERAKMIAMKALKPQDLSRLAIAGLKAKANGIQTQGAGQMAFSFKRAFAGQYEEKQFIVPETDAYLEDNDLSDLAYFDEKPIRLQVGSHKGKYGIMHLLGNSEDSKSRKADSVTDDDAENAALDVVRILSQNTLIGHKEDGGKYVLRAPLLGKAIVLRDIGSFWTVQTVLPSAANKWGVEDWRGRLTLPLPASSGNAAPETEQNTEKSRIGASAGRGVTSTKFNPSDVGVKRQVEVSTKKRRIIVRGGDERFSKINQTSTAAFKKWFGDWSDPKAFSSKYPKDKTPVSQAVGDDGKPLILYHATNGDFNTFEPGRPTINSTTFGDVETERHGIFAAVDVKFAEEYLRSGSGKNVMSIYMDIKAPMDMREGPDGEHIRDIVENSDGKIRHNDFYNLPATETWSLFDGDFGETFVAAAKKAGYDGAIILENTGDRESSKEVYVAFDPTQIKSATGNNGDFDGRNPDIRYSRAVVNQPSAFNLPEWTRRDTVQQRVQDRYNRIRDVIKAVRNQGGNVNDLNDFSMGEDRFHGVAMERVNNIQDRLQSLLDEAKAKDITMEEVTMFAYAEHAPSRNAAMQQKNPNVTTGSGMSDQEAADIIAAADKEGKKADLEALTAKMREIAKDTMARQVSSGLTPQSEADVYQAKYGDKWVPLRGFETIDAEGNTFRGTGKGFNIRGKENLRALGRDSKAGQILENILLDAERTAIRSTKNTEVNHRFLRFVMDNPDKNLWEVDAVKTNRSLRGDKVKEDLVIDKSDNTIGMKVQGEMVYVKIHDNHLFEQLANQWNDIEMNGIPYLQDFSRYLAKSYTAWSPEFALYTNPARDIQAALFSITGREGIGMAGKFAKAYPKALKMAYNSEVKGNDDPLYAEYKAQGGKTGFWNHNNLETKVKEIETLIKDMEATAGKNPFRYSLKMLKALEAIVSNHAGALENATRFASYIAMRDAGRSREEAASFAKNLNVNFNRRGTWTAGIGSVVLFFNPAIQGIHNQYETLVHGKHKKQAWALMGAHIGAMAALALLNAAGGEDDDGVKWWDKIPDYEKERNMILVLPPYMKDLGIPIKDSTGRYLKIPMPYQWNIGAYAGTLAADTYRNSENPAEGTTLGKGALLLSKATATAYMPAGMPPTIAPFYQHMANKKAFGDGPLYPESPWNAHKPDSEKYSAKQKDTAWQEWASFVNSATGGDQFKKGIVSIPPAVWKNYVKTYLGGPMSFIEGIYDASAEEDITKAPFIRKAYGEVGLNADAGKFYQTTEKPIEAAKAYKDAAKSDPKYAKEMMQSEKVMIQLGELALNYKEQLGKFTKDDIRIKDNVDYTDAEKRLKLKINEKRRSDYQEEYLAKQRQKLGDASVK